MRRRTRRTATRPPAGARCSPIRSGCRSTSAPTDDDQPGRAELGGRVRDGVPDPDLDRRTNWTTIYSTTTGTGGIQTLNITGTGRYVRMYGTVARRRLRLLAVGVPGLRHARHGPPPSPRVDDTARHLRHHQRRAEQDRPPRRRPRTRGYAAPPPRSTATPPPAGPASPADPQWLQVDLGSTQAICKVTLNWEAAYAHGFQIQTSTDATQLDRRSTPPPPAPAASRT